MISQETTYLKSEFNDGNENNQRMDFYLFPIKRFNQFALDKFYEVLRNNFPLNVLSDIGRGSQRPSGEIIRDVWGMPYIIARGTPAKEAVKKITKEFWNIDFGNIKRIKADSPSRLVRILGFIQ